MNHLEICLTFSVSTTEWLDVFASACRNCVIFRTRSKTWLSRAREPSSYERKDKQLNQKQLN